MNLSMYSPRQMNLDILSSHWLEDDSVKSPYWVVWFGSRKTEKELRMHLLDTEWSEERQFRDSMLAHTLVLRWHGHPLATPRESAHFSRYRHLSSIVALVGGSAAYSLSPVHRPVGIVHMRVPRCVSHMKYWSRRFTQPDSGFSVWKTNRSLIHCPSPQGHWFR